MPNSERSRHRRWARWAPIVFVALLTALVFLNAAPEAFVFDDANFLPIPRAMGESLWLTVGQLFTGDVWQARRLNVDAYRPLTFLSLVADDVFFGSKKWGFHATSIALHVAVTVVLYEVLLTLLARAAPGPSNTKSAALSAAVFGVHPVHTEAVDCAFNRGDLFVALWTLVALLSLVRLADRNGRRAWIFAGGAYALGLFSKENAVTLPILAVTILAVALPEKSFRERLRDTRPALWLLLPLGLFLVARRAALGHSTWTYEHVLSFGRSLELTLTAFRDSLAIIAVPWPLRAVRSDYAAEAVALAALIAVAFGMSIPFAWRAKPGVAAGLLFFAVAALPGLPVVTNIANAQPMAERYLYVPSIGLAMALAFGLDSLQRRVAAASVSAGMAAALGVLGLLTWSRNEAWHSDVALFEAELAATPSNAEAAMDLGGAYSAAGRPDDALALCASRKAGPEEGLERLFMVCARILEARGRFDEAEPYFRSGARGDAPPAAYIVYARFLIRMNRKEAAEAEFEKAIDMERDPVRKHTTRAEMLLKLHPDRLDQALREVDAALAEAPSYEIAVNLRRRIVAAMGAAPDRTPTPAEPSVTASTPAPKDGSAFSETAVATLLRVLGEAPPGSPAWVTARADDSGAIARADAMASALTRAGWNVKKNERTNVPVRQGVFLYAAEDEPPAFVRTVHRALGEIGLQPTFATGYRSYYEEMLRTKPGYQGFALAPDQSFILVFGRVQ